jgi:hypothetical protein
MAPTQHEPSVDRRRLADRRARPTTLWSTLRWQGRRTGCRRAGEGRHAYVDGLARRTVVLALLVFGGSLLDALFTLRHLQQGGQEANPLLALALTDGTARFLHLKLSLTGVGVWMLAVHQQWPLAVRSLHGLTLGYGAVLVYHLLLSWHLV